MNIRILGKDYAVVRKTREEQPDELGLCFEWQQILAIRDDLPAETFLDTLLHECLHAIDYGMQLKLTERQVHGAATGVIALLRDNPHLLVMLRCLTKTLNDSSDSTEQKSASSKNKSDSPNTSKKKSSPRSRPSKKT